MAQRHDTSGDEYRNFIRGLRKAIETSEQYRFAKDFADGLVNPVNLSKQLNFKMRMSPELMQRCAERLGLSVAEIAAIGGNSNTTPSPPSDFIYQQWNTDELGALSRAEFMHEMNRYKTCIRDFAARQVDQFEQRFDALVAVADRHHEQSLNVRAILESITDGVVVVAKGQTVTYKNRAFELLQKNSGACFVPPGDGDQVADVPWVDVFITGIATTTTQRAAGATFCITASPLFSAAGTVEQVVLVIRQHQQRDITT